MRIMGLDFGSKTVGVAISDERKVVALPLETIKREREGKLRRTFARIEALVSEYEVESFLLGNPLNMDASSGERVRKTKAFGEELGRRTRLEVSYWDERLTTRSADGALAEVGVKAKNRKEHVDQVAAAIQLQGYLDYRNKESADGGE